MSLWVLFAPDPGAPETDLPGADKLVHLLLFALLALTGRWWLGSSLGVLAGVAAYAGTSEVVQARLLVARTGDGADVVADLVGVVLGWLAARRLAPPRP